MLDITAMQATAGLAVLGVKEAGEEEPLLPPLTPAYNTVDAAGFESSPISPNWFAPLANLGHPIPTGVPHKNFP